MNVPDDQPKLLEKILFVVFAFFLVTSTFSVALSQVSLGLSLVLFIALVIAYPYQPFVASLRWFYIAVAIYIGWLVVSALAGPTPLASLRVSREEWMFAVVPVAILLLQREAYRTRLICWFAIAVGVVSIYAVIQYFTGVHWFHFEGGHLESVAIPYPSGNFSHSLTFGNYFATAGLFLFVWALEAPGVRRSDRWLGLMAALVAITATVLTQRRGPLVAVIAALALYGAVGGRRRRWMIIGATVALALSLGFLPSLRGPLLPRLQKDLSQDYEGSRIFIWKNSLQIISEHPLFGVGQGNFQKEYVSKLRQDIPDNRKHSHAHNDILNMGAVAGVPGAVVFTAMWLVLFGYLWRGNRHATFSGEQRARALVSLIASAAFFVTSLSEATFADDEVRQMLMFVWAFGLAVWFPRQKVPTNRTIL